MRARASIRSHANARGFVRRANTLHCGIRKSLISFRFNHPLREYHREKERESERERESGQGRTFEGRVFGPESFSCLCFRTNVFAPPPDLRTRCNRAPIWTPPGGEGSRERRGVRLYYASSGSWSGSFPAVGTVAESVSLLSCLAALSLSLPPAPFAFPPVAEFGRGALCEKRPATCRILSKYFTPASNPIWHNGGNAKSN